jgi:hypothetical protein
VAVLAVVATPAAADWLVTRAGDRVETKGPWEVKSRLVVFTLPDGQLASLRLSEVDLEASRAATADAVAAAALEEAEAASPAPVEKRKPVLVLRDGDVRRAADAPAEESGEGDGEAAEATQAPPVRIESWSQGQDSEDGSVVIRGVVENGSASYATGIAVTVSVYDTDGSPLATTEVAAQPPALRPGQKGEFEASFPGVYTLASVKIDPRSTLLDTNAATSADQAAADDQAATEEPLR